MRRNKIKNLILILIIALFASGVFSFSVSASSTDGTIDSTHKYAWGENIGWVNFGTTEGNVHVTDPALTGYAWSPKIGWISLNCSNTSSCADVDFKVSNNGQGSLSGYAWSENIGWINFNPASGGVSINSSGEFSGYAYGPKIGWIVFNCASTNSCGAVNYKAKTDWRPQNTRSSGSGLPPQAYNPPAPPPPTEENPGGGFAIAINGGDAYTEDRIVTLKFSAGSDTRKMAISNYSDFRGAAQEPYGETKTWMLSEGEGEKTVFAKFYTEWGQASDVVSDSIAYRMKTAPKETPQEASNEETASPEQDSAGQNTVREEDKSPAEPQGTQKETVGRLPAPNVKPPDEKPKKPIIEQVSEILKPLIPESLKPKPSEIKPPEVPVEELVPKEAPLAFQGKWYLLPSKPIKEFVLAPLPKKIRELAQKFPELEKTFEEVGIRKITDVEKLKTAKLSLPGLTERVGLLTGEIQPEKTNLSSGVPIAKLSPQVKRQLPAEVIFAKTGGELIDFNIGLSVTDKGEPQQKIATISGKPLQLAVKPDKPVKSVKGYVVFKSKAIQPALLDLPLDSLLASVIFANPVFAHEQEKPVRVEEKLVLLEFEYSDPDGDGIYTAEIQTPVVDGEYEIITVMDFEDPELGKKEIRLISVIDPEGYVYEKNGGKETRVPEAVVSLYWLNRTTGKYELWPASEYQQENPQVTDERGTYSFLVPEGSYYVKVDAPVYRTYEGKQFQVKEGGGIHSNIELKSKYGWLEISDWRTILLIIVVFLLLYNFYRDKMRDKNPLGS